MLSRMVYARVNYPVRRIADIPGTVQEQLRASGFGSNLAPGARVAIGVGSRGIANIATIVRAVVEGYNGCIFAYGQTNSGKTHTI